MGCIIERPTLADDSFGILTGAADVADSGPTHRKLDYIKVVLLLYEI